MANYRLIPKDESLSHHGIEGQKWGVRNGPPYPLETKDYSPAEKKAMKRDSQKAWNVVRKTKLTRRKMISPLKNPQLAKIVSKKLEEHNEEFISFFKSNSDLGTFKLMCNNIARECLGKYADRQVYAHVKRLMTDFGRAKYGVVHNIGTAEEVLGNAIYQMYVDLAMADLRVNGH